MSEDTFVHLGVAAVLTPLGGFAVYQAIRTHWQPNEYGGAGLAMFACAGGLGLLNLVIGIGGVFK